MRNQRTELVAQIATSYLNALAEYEADHSRLLCHRPQQCNCPLLVEDAALGRIEPPQMFIEDQICSLLPRIDYERLARQVRDEVCGSVAEIAAKRLWSDAYPCRLCGVWSGGDIAGNVEDQMCQWCPNGGEEEEVAS